MKMLNRHRECHATNKELVRDGIKEDPHGVICFRTRASDPSSASVKAAKINSGIPNRYSPKNNTHTTNGVMSMRKIVM